MQVTDKLTKALTEAKYLNADNVSRYRCIMRIFFENYEKLRYWLYQEEVYAQMIQDPFFADYKPEQCQQDLAMLVEWKNLNTIQDTKKVSSIEEFKNKKLTLIYNSYAHKDYKEVLTILKPIIDEVYIVPLEDKRVVKKEILESCLKSLDIKEIKSLEFDNKKIYLAFGSFLVVERFLELISYEKP